MTLCTFYILVYTVLLFVAKLLVMSFDSSCGFLFYHLHYYGGCQYVTICKFAKLYIQISLFVNYSIILYILQFCSVNVFTVFLYFLQNYSGNHSCQNYFVKTTDFVYSVD